MYTGPYFMPNFYSSFAPNFARGVVGNAARGSAMRGVGAFRGMNLFSRLGNSLHSLRSINWSGIINNTSKTLGIINQSIPVVKQVGPMMNNMKSMIRVASLFKDETDRGPKVRNHSQKVVNNQSNNLQSDHTSFSSSDELLNDYSPTFFVES